MAVLPLKISPPRLDDDSKDSSATTGASQSLPHQEPPSDDTTVIVDPAEVIVEPEIMVDVEDPAEFYPSKDGINAQIYWILNYWAGKRIIDHCLNLMCLSQISYCFYVYNFK